MSHHALLVGINEYRPGSGIPALKYAESDARDLAESLRSHCGFECVTLLGQDATHDRIVTELENAGSGDLFVFFFAGHGESVEGGYYLHPHDGRAAVGLRSIDFAKFMRHWGSAGFGYAHCVAILDACRSSLGGSGQRGSEGLSESDTRDIVAARQRSERDLRILYGCDYGQCSHEFDELRHGVLTYHLVEVIRQRPQEDLTLAYLVEEASDRMRNWMRTHKGRALQSPQWLGTPTRRQIILAAKITEPPTLSVVTVPAGARISVGGRECGQSPLSLRLPSGEHRIRAEKEGFEVWDQMVRFEAAGDAELRIELRRVTPKKSKPVPPSEPAHLRPEWTAEKKRVVVATPEGDPEKEITYFTNALGMRFVLIPAGEFMMGSPEEEEGRYAGERAHRAIITTPFYLGACEVTQRQYEMIMDKNPSLFKGADLPVENVSWNEAQEFCTKLSEKVGEMYRLPTEAEWEYACRAGTQRAYYWGDRVRDDCFWHDSNSDRKTHPGCQRPANGFGLYDMSGNVWEWCQDWHDRKYYKWSRDRDPTGPSSGEYRVIRGGSWFDSLMSCRSAHRGKYLPAKSGNTIGFRIVCIPAMSRA